MMSEQPRAFTPDEMRDRVIEGFREAARYWAALPEVDKATGRQISVGDRCDGVAFTILSMLDGCGSLPSVALVFCPHESDEASCRENGENWVEDGTAVCDMLHEHYYRHDSPKSAP